MSEHTRYQPQTTYYQQLGEQPLELLEAQVAEEWQVGDVILDLYEISAVLGVGGMGKVYRAHHRGWNLDLAVKCPKAEMFAIRKGREAYIQEAQTWIELGLHPHICSCYYVRTLGGVPRLFAECVEGGSLESWIESGKLYESGKDKALERMLDIAIQFAWGLEYAHDQGLVHQDVKPHNVLLTPEGVAKVTDFGLANAVGQIGTVAYHSPEQAARQPLTLQTDIWSWAVSVLEMFTGGVTWMSGAAGGDVLQSYLELGETDEGLPAMPEELAALLQRCLQEDPAQRPADMGQVTGKLEKIYCQISGQSYFRQQAKSSELRPDSLNNKAISLLDLGKQAEAETILDQVVALDSHHVDAAHNLGLVRWRSGQVNGENVLQALDQIRQDRPGDASVVSAIAWFCLESGRIDEALEHFEQAERLGSDLDTQRGLNLTRALLDTGFGRCLRTFAGHEKNSPSTAFSPDGSQVISWTWSGDHTLKLWDVATGKQLRTFKGHENNINAVVFSPDGRYVLSGGGGSGYYIDNDLRLWELITGKCLRTFKGHEESVWSVAFSPDGSKVLSGGMDKKVKLWDVDTGICLWTYGEYLGGHTGLVGSVAFSPDGSRVLSGSSDKTLKLWHVSGKRLRDIKGHASSVHNVTFSPDGRQALCDSGHDTLTLWDLNTGKSLGNFKGMRGVFSQDGRRILSSGERIMLWDVGSGKCLYIFEGLEAGIVTKSFNPDGFRVLTHSLTEHGAFELREFLFKDYQEAPLRYSRGIAGSEAVRRERDHSSNLDGARSALKKGEVAEALLSLERAREVPGYARDEESLVLQIQIGAFARITGVKDAWFKRTFEGHKEVVHSACFSFDGIRILSMGKGSTRDRIISKLWDVSTGECLESFSGSDTFDMTAGAIFRPDGRQVLFGGGVRMLKDKRKGMIILRGTVTDSRQFGFDGHEDNILSVAFSPDGRYILSGSNDDTLRLWEAATGECVRKFKGYPSGVRNLAFSSDGRHVLAGGADDTLSLWKTDTGKCLRAFEGRSDLVSPSAFSPDGRQVLSGSLDNSLKLWDVSTDKCLLTFEGHEKSVSASVFNPHGRNILSASWDKTIKLWDATTGKCLQTFSGHEDYVSSIDLSPDGRWVASGSGDNTLKLWEAATGECLVTLKGHKEGVNSVAFSPDGRYLLSASGDKTVKLWEVDWVYQFPGWSDWDEGARPYLDNFLTGHTLEKHSLFKKAVPIWTNADFQQLLVELRYRGYGWLNPDGVRRRLEEMAKER